MKRRPDEHAQLHLVPTYRVPWRWAVACAAIWLSSYLAICHFLN